jgi:hypothetical protein
MPNNRAVSEVISFALIFALIVSTVSMVYLTGLAGLEDARDAEQANNAERAFDVLADNMGDIHEQGAPSRSTEIRLSEANLFLAEPSSVIITVTDTGTGTTNTFTKDVYPVVYDGGGDTRIVYEAGLVIREDRSAATVNSGDGVLFVETAGGDRRAVLKLIETRPARSGVTNIGGSTTALVQATLGVSEVLYGSTDSQYEVTYEVQTTATRAPAIEAFLEDQIPDAWNSDACAVSGDVVTCSVTNLDSVHATRVGIDVSFTN